MIRLRLPEQLWPLAGQWLAGREDFLLKALFTGYVAGVGLDVARLEGFDPDSMTVLVKPLAEEAECSPTSK